MDKSELNPHNVLAMTEFRAEIGFSAISQVEAYWEGLRGARVMPKRSEIDPRGIESALEYTFVLERIAPGMARIRIAGSHLGDLMGMEVRGMPLTSLITPPCRRQIADAIEDVCQRPAVCELRMSGETTISKPQMDARLLLLPLKSDLGDVSRILGCMVAHGDIGHTPRRFNVVGARIRPISAPSTAPVPVKPVAQTDTQNAKVDGFAESQKNFETTTPRSDVPYLRLVKSDDR
ncbi:PAS domain-containing protein [Tateyamaria omphalii]|uniref:PAS domain-containing protein n=1 Tax=Tateyamaria omphalii TaxID=299262 RepID=UPI001C998B29|nr:PAS domain-containing protein [Tateyamaria omphalii]MBY5932592.1 PAS domain-containing protein [Tateyamaria omphalii]